MANRSFYSGKILGFRIASGIVIFVSLVAITWGLRLVIAHGGVQGSSLAALYAVGFGLCALIIGVIIFFVFWSQDSAYARNDAKRSPGVGPLAMHEPGSETIHLRGGGQG